MRLIEYVAAIFAAVLTGFEVHYERYDWAAFFALWCLIVLAAAIIHALKGLKP